MEDIMARKDWLELYLVAIISTPPIGGCGRFKMFSRVMMQELRWVVVDCMAREDWWGMGLMVAMVCRSL